MFHGREKKENKGKTKKQKLTDIKDREDMKSIKDYEQTTFNRPKSSNEISVIHPVKEKDKN